MGFLERFGIYVSSQKQGSDIGWLTESINKINKQREENEVIKMHKDASVKEFKEKNNRILNQEIFEKDRIRRMLSEELSLYDPKELLMSVKNKVWRVGKIVKEEKIKLGHTSYVEMALRYSYPEFHPGSVGSVGDGGCPGSDASRARGMVDLTIGAELKESKQVDLYVGYNIRHYGRSPFYIGNYGNPAEKLTRLKEVLGKEVAREDLPRVTAHRAKEELKRYHM